MFQKAYQRIFIWLLSGMLMCLSACGFGSVVSVEYEDGKACEVRLPYKSEHFKEDADAWHMQFFVADFACRGDGGYQQYDTQIWRA